VLDAPLIWISAVVGTYDGTLELVDLTPMQSYGLVAEGKGRPGFVKGKAAIALASEAAATTLTDEIAGDSRRRIAGISRDSARGRLSI
jgi:carbon monoxide dehydrogenase subunit G